MGELEKYQGLCSKFQKELQELFGESTQKRKPVGFMEVFFPKHLYPDPPIPYEKWKPGRPSKEAIAKRKARIDWIKEHWPKPNQNIKINYKERGTQ